MIPTGDTIPFQYLLHSVSYAVLFRTWVLHLFCLSLTPLIPFEKVNRPMGPLNNHYGVDNLGPRYFG